MKLKEALEILKNINFEDCKKRCELDCFDCYIGVEEVRAIDTLRETIIAQEKEIEHYKNSYEAEKDRRKEETKYLEEQIRYWEESTKEANERLEEERWRE